MSGWTRKTRAGGASIGALALMLVLPGAVSGEPTENWTQWGGPRHDFSAPSKGLAGEWPESGPPKLWSRELGDGYSTILAENGRLYTMYRAGEKEAVICLDAGSGKTIWEHRYDHDPHEGHVTQFGSGPRSTPLLSGDRLFTIGIAGKMHGLDKKNGKVAWTHELWGEEFGGTVLSHGYSSSPIAYKDTVIALVGGEGKSLVAFHQRDGSVAWQRHSFKNSYSTPRILEVDSQEQLVTFMANEVIGVDPGSGELLWSYPMANQFEQNINPPSLVDGQYLFLSSTAVGARGLKLSRNDGKTEVEELWSTRKIQFYHVTSVLAGDYVYGSSGARSPAFMAAVNVKTGEIPWRKRGFAKANAIYADGHMIVLDEDGKLYLTTPTPEDLTVHSQAEVLERPAWSAPTLVGKTMYLRDKVHIMALDLSPAAMAKAPATAEASAMQPKAPADRADAEGAMQQAEPVPPAGDDNEAVAILRKADAAIKAVDGVRYKIHTRPTGVVTNFASAAEGEAVMWGWDGRGAEKSYAHLEGTRPGSDEPMRISGGGDGEMYFLLDHQAHKAYEDIDPGVLGTGGQALSSFLMVEFVHPAPFDDEISADKVELVGKQDVAGASCYKIDVTYSGGRGRSTWLISTEDYLPRGRIRYFSIPQQGEGTLEVTLSEIEVNPEIEPAIFRLQLPAGYEKVDDFAP